MPSWEMTTVQCVREMSGPSVMEEGWRSCPVAGTPGDHLPHAFIKLIAVFLDGKILAAHRAAYGDYSSTEVEHGFLAADPAFHKNLKAKPFRHDNRIYKMRSDLNFALIRFYPVILSKRLKVVCCLFLRADDFIPRYSA